jgi:hypothetical protein
VENDCDDDDVVPEFDDDVVPEFDDDDGDDDDDISFVSFAGSKIDFCGEKFAMGESCEGKCFGNKIE